MDRGSFYSPGYGGGMHATSPPAWPGPPGAECRLVNRDGVRSSTKDESLEALQLCCMPDCEGINSLSLEINLQNRRHGQYILGHNAVGYHCRWQGKSIALPNRAYRNLGPNSSIYLPMQLPTLRMHVSA